MNSPLAITSSNAIPQGKYALFRGPVLIFIGPLGVRAATPKDWDRVMLHPTDFRRFAQWIDENQPQKQDKP